MTSMSPIDLRSDTVTIACSEMRERMANARVGDALIGEDPTVLELEERVASFFGFRFSSFIPSGTMSNQILLRSLSEPGDAVMCHPLNHIVLYESGALSALTGLQLLAAPMKTDQTHIDSAGLRNWQTSASEFYRPPLKIIAIENTSLADAGRPYDRDAWKELRQTCDQVSLHLHVDGARIWHALRPEESDARWIGALCTSLSVCLSKGMGAPVGSVALVHDEIHFKRLKRFQKMYGGFMRQAGHLAAAGLYALDHNLPRLLETHRLANLFAHFCRSAIPQAKVHYNGTNIVLLEAQDSTSIIQRLFDERGLRLSLLRPGMARAVFHLDIPPIEFESRL